MNNHVNDQVSDRPVLLTASFLFVTTNAAVFVFLAVGIVPYWQTLSGTEIQEWFADDFGRFARMMIPVHLLAISTTIAAFIYARRRANGSTALWWTALIGLLVSQAFNFTIFGLVLNPDLSSQDLTPADALDTLDTWDLLHLIRTAFVVIAVGALAILVNRRGRTPTIAA